jgi:hypothetical protein
VPGATVEKYIAQQGWIGCVQEKGWFDGPVAQIWVEKVLKPHVQNANQALLLLDHFSVHLTSEFVQSINDLGVNIEYIPAGYTCVLQPVDVGVNAPFKKAIRNLHHSWCMKKYPVVPNGDKLPTPKRDDVYGWVVEAFEKVSSELIVKTFKYIDLVTADIDDDNKTETDYTTEYTSDDNDDSILYFSNNTTQEEGFFTDPEGLQNEIETDNEFQDAAGDLEFMERDI